MRFHKRDIVKQCLVLALTIMLAAGTLSADPKLGSRSYDDYDRPAYCGTSCHTDFYRQWQQAMMSQAYIHHWDEIEYFELAIPHAERDEKVAEVKKGCNICHTPLAYMAGDVPPPRPEKGSRANEAVSCEVCHTITGFEGDVPFNGNYISEPGRKKYGPRSTGSSPAHERSSPTSLAPPSSAAPAITRKAPTVCGSNPPTWNGKRVRTPGKASSATIAT